MFYIVGLSYGERVKASSAGIKTGTALSRLSRKMRNKSKSRLLGDKLQHGGRAGALQVLLGAELEDGAHLLAGRIFLEAIALQVSRPAAGGHITDALGHDAVDGQVEGVGHLFGHFAVLEVGDLDIRRTEAKTAGVGDDKAHEDVPTFV